VHPEFFLCCQTTHKKLTYPEFSRGYRLFRNHFNSEVPMFKIAILSCVVLFVHGLPNAIAQGYPSKSIRLIAPYPPGGGIDASARIIAQALTDQLGQSVVVENRAGATGRIGTEIAARSPADGYTLLLGSGAPSAVIPSVSPTVPYDAIKDFAPISLVGLTEYTLVVHPSLPVHSVKELLALARANPGELTYGSSGALSNVQLAGEFLKLLGKVNIREIPYKGTGPALVSVLTGETAMAFGGGPAVAPHVQSKRLRALATTGSKRRDPNVPTIGETLPGYNVNQWYGVLAPAGTPRDIVNRLHKEIVRAVENPKLAGQFRKLGTDPVTNKPEEFLAFIQSEIEKWRKVIRAAKIPVE
jgi:tripartite-type tricarboxylate transporter receptor subunit TctC